MIVGTDIIIRAGATSTADTILAVALFEIRPHLALMTLVSQSRVKSYLRGTMKQEMLNNLMIHKEHTDELNLKQVANDFVSIKQ